MAKPQGVIFRGIKQISDVPFVTYDKSETYDKNVPYYGSYDFVSIPPQAVVQLGKLSANIEI